FAAVVSTCLALLPPQRPLPTGLFAICHLITTRSFLMFDARRNNRRMESKAPNCPPVCVSAVMLPRDSAFAIIGPTTEPLSDNEIPCLPLRHLRDRTAIAWPAYIRQGHRQGSGLVTITTH